VEPLLGAGPPALVAPPPAKLVDMTAPQGALLVCARCGEQFRKRSRKGKTPRWCSDTCRDRDRYARRAAP
jgi:hypothetical protein